MLTVTQVTGCILTPKGWVRGTLAFDRRITLIDGDATLAPGEDERLVLPGFIDLHVHGGGGADVMDGGTAIDTVARLHAGHGTTSLLATTMTAPRQDIERALAGVGRAVCERPAGAARVLGAHLEGPFINSKVHSSIPLSGAHSPMRCGRVPLRNLHRCAHWRRSAC